MYVLFKVKHVSQLLISAIVEECFILSRISRMQCLNKANVANGIELLDRLNTLR